MILRGRAEHGRAADIDLLDRLRERGVRLRHGFAEWIEVYGDKVDRRDGVLLHGGDVTGIISSRQQPAVNFWMQGLYSPIHHLREAGNLFDRDDRNPFATQSFGGATSRDDLPAELHQLSGELHKAPLI